MTTSYVKIFTEKANRELWFGTHEEKSLNVIMDFFKVSNLANKKNTLDLF